MHMGHHEEMCGCGCQVGPGHEQAVYEGRLGHGFGHGGGYGGECSCGQHEHHHHEHQHGPCCRGGHHEGYGGHGWGHAGMGFQRRFFSKAERKAKLEEYLKALEAEAQGVREAIQSMD